MAKSNVVKLFGRCYSDTRELVVARTQDADEVVCFIGASPEGTIAEYFHVEKAGVGYTLTTPKGKYTLLSLVKRNHYKCVTPTGVEVTFVPKKIVADLSFEVTR